MAKNAGLQAANKAKKDEFYTAYEDIQLEMNHYEDKFKNKTVLCNCDDPFESNFCKFFLRNFNYLGLKRLICTSYRTSPIVGAQMTIYDLLDEPVQRGNGYVMDITEVPMSNGRGVSDDDIDKLLKSKKRGVGKLAGDGDFRSDECLEYLKLADIVVTNPPFSLFREFVATLVEYNKQFLIIGNVNAITYKEIFPLIKDNKLWLGASIHSGDRKFYVPDDYPLNAATCGVDDDGRKFIRVKGVRWFTNIDYAMRHEELDLYRRYYGHEDEYPKYDNYDAINVDKTSDIPCDYFEDFGVPFTFLDKYNPEQFDIIKFRKGNDDKDLTYTVEGDTIATDRQTDRQTENHAVLQNHHQEEAVMESSEFLSPSSTSSTRINSRLSEQLKAKERVSQLDCGLKEAVSLNPLLEENASTRDYSSRERCNGVMGVPITFLDKYNPDQFEIVGRADANIAKEGNPYHIDGIPDKGGAPLINGKYVYKRILIKRRISNGYQTT